MNQHSAIGHFAKIRVAYVQNYAFPPEFSVKQLVAKHYKNRYLRLQLQYQNITYTITLAAENNRLYWQLSPYQGSLFRLHAISSQSFQALLYAIQENEKLLQNDFQPSPPPLPPDTA